jgi:hypothetical protein
MNTISSSVAVAYNLFIVLPTSNFMLIKSSNYISHSASRIVQTLESLWVDNE